MANVIQWDKCGKVGAKVSDFRYIDVHNGHYPITNNKIIKRWDLCHECYGKVFDFIENKKEE